MPLGLAAWFQSCGVKHAVELDWWDEVRHPGSDLRLTFTPAQVTTAGTWLPFCMCIAGFTIQRHAHISHRPTAKYHRLHITHAEDI